MHLTETKQPRVPLIVEVRLQESARAWPKDIEAHVHSYLSGRTVVYADATLLLDASAPAILTDNVQEIRICDTAFNDSIAPGAMLMNWQADLQVYAYHANNDGPADAEEMGEEATPSFMEWQLPSQAFCGLWESLIYGENVDPHLVSFNRTVLLHGPPGSGKTSLSKALAQKLAIRFQSRYQSSQLIEVNAHSLFSKWFAESGKLVTGLFARIREAVEEDNLVFVLVDEVESLAAARQAAISGSEPADAVRAVNALLTGLDSLSKFPNVMVLTTSNLTTAIDIAFVDRADIKAYLGPPDLQARYGILSSCIRELQRCQIISSAKSSVPCFQDLPPQILTENGCKFQHKEINHEIASMAEASLGDRLRQVALRCEGMSGRTLRKLPFLAHVLMTQQDQGAMTGLVQITAFLDALQSAIEKENFDRQQMNLP